MKWLWFVGPALFVFVATLNAIWPTLEERRLRREIVRWLEEFLSRLPGSGAQKSQKAKDYRSDEEEEEGLGRVRRVKRLPKEFSRLVDGWQNGTRLADIVLLPKKAYVAIRGANGAEDANTAAVLMKLAGKKVPSFLCRPIPFVDGEPGPNRGTVQLKDDEEFMETYQIESVEKLPAPNAKAVDRWLSDDLREMLLDNPELWLTVDGKVAAVQRFGTFDAETLDELVDAADRVYVEHGVSDESLFGDGEPAGAGALDSKHQPQSAEEAPKAVRLKGALVDSGLLLASLVVLAAVVGAFPSFHPRVLFNSPDPVVTESWQGGWTTKGVGALIAGESLLVGLVTAHAWLVAGYGRTIGRGLFGGRIVGEDGKAPGFVRGVVLRYWVFALIPIGITIATAPAKTIRGFFYHLPTMVPLAVTALTVAVLCAAPAVLGWGLQDRLSKTKVVAADPYRVENIEVTSESTLMARVASAALAAAVTAAGVFLTSTLLSAFLD